MGSEQLDNKHMGMRSDKRCSHTGSRMRERRTIERCVARATASTAPLTQPRTDATAASSARARYQGEPPPCRAEPRPMRCLLMLRRRPVAAKGAAQLALCGSEPRRPARPAAVSTKW